MAAQRLMGRTRWCLMAAETMPPSLMLLARPQSGRAGAGSGIRRLLAAELQLQPPQGTVLPTLAVNRQLWRLHTMKIRKLPTAARGIWGEVARVTGHER